MESAHSPDDILKDLGGCGRFQIRMSVVVHMMKALACFSTVSIMIASQIPEWSCDSHIISYNRSVYPTHKNSHDSCFTDNNTKCTKFSFEGKASIVGEYNLVCDRAFIPATIASAQTAGSLLGNLLGGQLGDLVGRKKPLFVSLVIMIFGNFLGFVVNSWIALLVAKIVVGIGAGTFISCQFSLLSEFTLSKWRSVVIGFPSWALQTCLFALLAWWIQDWRYLMLMCGCMGVPCLFTWWIIPESFRWYIANDRKHDANHIIKTMAKFNKHSEILSMNTLLANDETVVKTTHDRTYTILELIRPGLIRVTLLSAMNWLTLGLCSAGINFGVKALSGNIYFNTILFNITSVPGKAIAIWLQNRCGRKKTAMLCYGISAVGGFVVGCVQYIETDQRDILTNVFALFASTGIIIAWSPVQTMTVELYPTVVRNVAFGTLSVVGQLGGIIGPQLVFLNNYVPGLLYFVCGILSTASIIGLCGLKETKDASLSDQLPKYKKTRKPDIDMK